MPVFYFLEFSKSLINSQILYLSVPELSRFVPLKLSPFYTYITCYDANPASDLE